MSSRIDERIVEMRFDNRQFERGVQTSIQSLDNLKSGLDLESSAKSLTNLEKVGRRFSLQGIADGVESLRNRFSTMGIVAMTVIEDMTRSAVNAGKKIVGALTIDPVKTGFQEYETQINAIQTILANTSSKGTTLENVTAALGVLNEYADKTIYNFTEMTRNIGTFTAAGIDLDKSTTAIKGIANLAAVSGSNSQQASTAMYQLSQALASGSVKLQDWNSVVNAGMGGAIFQDSLVETARMHGVAIDSMIKNEGSFRETLSDGWLTSEILLETLSKFTGDLNEEQLKTMGYTNEQIKSILEMGQMANDAATKVKTFTQLWDTLKEAAQSGWTKSWEIIIGDFDEAKHMLTSVSDVMGAMIGASADARNSMLEDWKTLGGRTVLIDSVSNSFEALISLIAPIKTAFRDIFPPTTGEQLFNITKAIESLSEKLKIGDKFSTDIHRTFKGLFALLDIGRIGFKSLLDAIIDVVGEFIPISGSILTITGNVGDMIVSFRDGIKASNGFGNIFTAIGSILKPFVRVLANVVENIANLDLSVVGEVGDKLLERVKPLAIIGNITTSMLEGLGSAIKKVSPIFYELGRGLGNAFETIGNAIAVTFTGSEFNTLLDFVNTGVLVTLGGGLKGFIDSLTDITSNAGGTLGSITDILDGVKGSLEAYQSSLKADILLKIAGAIALLAGSLAIIAMIDSAKLTTSLGAMTVMLGQLFGAMTIFSKLSGLTGLKNITVLTIGLTGISTALLILSVAMKTLSGLEWDDVLTGLAGIAGLLGVLVGATKMMNTAAPGLITTSIGLIGIAVAIRLLTSSIEEIGNLDMVVIGKGLLGIGALLVELALFTKLANLDGMGLLKGAGMIALAVGINLLAVAVSKFGTMDVNSLMVGISAMGISLGVIAGFTRLIPPNLAVTAGGLVVISAAILVLSTAIKSMGSMSWEEAAKGISIMGMSLSILALGVIAMQGGIGGAAALLVVAGALALLTPVLHSLGNMSLSEIGYSLLSLVGVFVVLGGATLILAPLIPTMLGLTAALALFGAGVALIGGGIFALSAGLASLAVSGTAGALAIVSIVTSIVGLIPMFLEQIARALIGFATVIGEGAPAIIKAVSSLIVAMMDGIATSLPSILKTFGLILTGFLDLMIKYTPLVVDGALKILIGFMQGITDNIDQVIDTAGNLIIAFIEGITRLVPKLVQAGFDLIIDFINGLADAITDNTPELIDAIKNLFLSLVGAGLEILSGSVSLIFESAEKLMDSGLIKGVLTKTKEFASSVGDVIAEGVKVIPEKITEFISAGGDLVDGFIQGIKGKMASIREWGANIGKEALVSAKSFLDIRSPSKKFEDEVGAMLGAGMAAGIKKSSKKSTAASAQMSKDAYEVAKEWVDERKFYNNLSMEEELHVWLQLASKYKAGTEIRKKADKEVYTIKKALEKEAYDFSIKWIDQRKYYNELSLDDELAAWERVHARYIDGSEEKISAEKEIYRVKQEIEKASYDYSMDWIDDKKYYNNLSLTEELAAYERVQARYVEGTEERKKMDREVYRIQQELHKINEDYSKRKLEIERNSNDELTRLNTQYESDAKQIKEEANKDRIALDEAYYQATTEINERLLTDIQTVNKEYEDAVKTRANTLYNSYGLFDSVGVKEAVDGETLVENLHRQVEELRKWRASIAELTSRGLDEGLMDELTAMGPKSAASVEALSNLTDTQLQDYVLLWREKHAEANSQAISELEDMRHSTIIKIHDLKKDSENELQDYRLVWATNMDNINSDTEIKMQELLNKYGADVRQLKEDTNTELNILKTDWTTNMRITNEAVVGEVDSMSANVIGGVSSMRTKTESEFSAMSNGLETIMRSPDWYSVGVDIMDGLRMGIRSKARDLATEAATVANGVLTAARETLGINSPSKEFQIIGEQSNDGFGNGLLNSLKNLLGIVKDVGSTTIDSLLDTMTTYNTLAMAGIDTNPVISPVIDLTKAKSTLATLFTSGASINVKDTTSRTRELESRQNGSNTQQTIVQESPIYIAKMEVRSDDDIKSVANELHNLRDERRRGRGGK